MTAHPGRALRDKMDQGTVVTPGSFNGLVARAVARAGFEATYVSGAATAATSGYPDIGLITLTEMTRTIREVADASKLPVLADGDTGYGEVEGVIRTVVEYERAGAAAIHIEDQVFPKRCGHLDGKTLIGKAAMAEKIAAAAEHRLSRDFVIVARTDARSVTSIEDAIDRANEYREAGADMIFPESLRSEEEFERFAKECPGLLLANMTEFGKTPPIPVSVFAEMGYSLVLFAVSLMRLAMTSVERGLQVLKAEGAFTSTVPEMQTRRELYELLNYTPGVQWNYPNIPEFSTDYES